MGSETKKVPAFDGADRTITYSAVFQENGWRKVRQAPKDRQAKTDPIKGQEACLLLTGIQ